MVLLCVIALDFQIRRHPGRSIEVILARLILGISLMLLIGAMILDPRSILGLLLALTCANAFIVHQRARSMVEAAKFNPGAGDSAVPEEPYEQFVNTFLSYFDRGDADTLEFEFRQWRMDIRFKKGAAVLPVTDTPFHMLLQIKRLFDAATVKNPKTGECKMRYIARGILYEFASEDIGGVLLRLRLLNKRPAAPDEIKAFDRTLAGIR